MRAKKKILLMCGSEVHANQLKFVLETRGRHRIFLSPDAEDALWQIKHRAGFDLVMAEMTMNSADGEELCGEVKRHDSRVPTLLFSRVSSDYERGGVADRFIPEIQCNSEVILGTVRILLSHKRGPKPRLAAVTA